MFTIQWLPLKNTSKTLQKGSVDIIINENGRAARWSWQNATLNYHFEKMKLYILRK